MMLGLGDINTLAAAIQQMEGYIAPNAQYPNGSLAYQNNNPGNIMYIGQPGAVLGAGGFAKWPTYDAGYQGLLNQINANASSGQTLSQFVCHYAGCSLDCSTCPPGANNTQVYLANLESATGASASTPLTAILSGNVDTTIPSALTDSGTDSTDASTLDLNPVDLITNAMSGDPTSIAIVTGTALLGLWLVMRMR